LKKYFFILVLINAVFATALSLWLSLKDASFAKEYFANKTYTQRVAEYNTVINDKKEFLKDFAKFLASSKEVKQAYLSNDKEKIISFVMPLYKSLYPNQIEEIHFFKPPAINFVNFANLKAPEMDISAARSDILWVSSSKKPSVHFYICRIYPGLRATYPILYKGKLLGSISFGIHINTILKLLRNFDTKSITLLLNDKTLKSFLLPSKYKEYEKYPLYNGFRVIGKNVNITPASGYEFKKGSIYSKIEIKDFFGNLFGYVVMEDSLKPLLERIKKHFIHIIVAAILGTIAAIMIIVYIFTWYKNKFTQQLKIIDIIRKRDFKHLPPKIQNPKDDIDKYTNKLIELGEDIKAYINIITNKLEDVENKVYTDLLTHTLNRNFLEDKQKELSIKLGFNPFNGIIMLDIDDFKKINDTYGHDIGDLVLSHLAETIKKIIRKDDLVIRYGGEEFVIILPNANLQETYQVAEKIRKTIEQTPLKINDDLTISYTISAGISEYRDDDSSIFEAIKRADINLYKAKKKGKNRVEL